MHPQTRTMLWLNLLGRRAVLGWRHIPRVGGRSGEACGRSSDHSTRRGWSWQLWAISVSQPSSWCTWIRLRPESGADSDFRCSNWLYVGSSPVCVVDAAYVEDDRAAIRSAVVGDSSNSRRGRPGRTGMVVALGMVGPRPLAGHIDGRWSEASSFYFTPACWMHSSAGSLRMIGQPLRAGSRRFRSPADPLGRHPPAGGQRCARSTGGRPEPVVVGAASEQPTLHRRDP